MSKEVTGSAAPQPPLDGGSTVDLDDPAATEEPQPPRGRLHRYGPTTASVLAVLALVGVGLAQNGAPDDRPVPRPSTAAPTASADDASDVTADPPVDARLFARVRPAGREGGDLDHVRATVELTNRGGVERRVVAVDLVGLGTATVDTPPAAPLAPQASVTLAATVSADCETSGVLPARVRVIELDRQGRRFPALATILDRDTLLDVLDPLCPPSRTGLHVAVVVASDGGGGVATVRVVNHGNLSTLVTPRAAPDAGGLRLVSQPPLPYDLGPGQAIVATLELDAADGTDGCPAGSVREAAAALYLEAETPYVFSEVTGFPQAALEAAVERWIADRGCPAAG
ncbi:hypothetical protein [Kineosporia sp. A_224]|uniref:hypothetical protein n=1 Tax=Kineosporia sp. A_224 TaxID=1962180 RepID=UPI000B4BCA03|nr:hypothetical protein [Kineosporia sp. A_224]